MILHRGDQLGRFAALAVRQPCGSLAEGGNVEGRSSRRGNEAVNEDSGRAGNFERHFGGRMDKGGWQLG